MKPRPLCPYCGKKPEVIAYGELGFAVRCQASFSHNVSVYGKSPEEAIQLWHEAFRKRRFWERRPK